MSSVFAATRLVLKLREAHSITQLQLTGSWHKHSHKITVCDRPSTKLIQQAAGLLRSQLQQHGSATCTNIKGNSGVKGAVRWMNSASKRFKYAARFDVHSYYESMNHQYLCKLLSYLNLPETTVDIIRQYIRLPDTNNKTTGITAGGALSPLLGVLYLFPLDFAMAARAGSGSTRTAERAG